MAYPRPISGVEDFQDKLDREFKGRLRIRWSAERGEWQIEQKVRRGMLEGFKPNSRRGWDESHDRYVQHRDGVVHIMSVRTGDRMACPKCESTLKVPFRETHMITCPLCKMRGKPHHFPAVYMSLGDDLINHLKSIDPENPISETLVEDLDRQNQALALQQERDALRRGEAAAHYDYDRIVGIPKFAYSGIKEFKG